MLRVTRDTPTCDIGISKDGEPLLLLPASKNLFAQITAEAEGITAKPPTEQLDITYRLAALILSNNTNGAAVTVEETAALDALTGAGILREYLEFMKGLKLDPNSASPTVPEARTRGKNTK